MDRPSIGNFSRRDALKLVGGAGLLGVGAIAADRSLSGADAPTTPVSDDRARELAESFAPDLYYDEHEEWYATDPRPYESERDGEVVVDGFDAYNGYSRAFDERGEPPAPTVFYRVLRYEDSPLAAVQYWIYSAFDQFATNFHWHDWELLQAFVDLETGAPQLYVASAHSRSVPNNEFLDPDPDRQPAIVAELGSHSSALAVNEVRDSFQRLSSDDLIADITNGVLESVGEIPKAYGLPRDEGISLSFAVPELDGEPIYEHPDLPDVTREHLVDSSLTAREYADLASPPEDLPGRTTGLQFGAGEDADRRYGLEPVETVTHIDAFVGPQLSFEFAIPGFAEDAIAGHITTTGVPWAQERFEDPAADITDRGHRVALADRYDAIDPGGPVSEVIGRLRTVEADDDAPDGNGVETTDTGTTAFALLESEPEAVPSFGGLVVAQGVPEGEHRLTVNAPGMAPYSEQVSVTGAETTLAGAEGDLPLVAKRNAVKLGVDGASGDSVDRLAVEDDFGGRLLEATPDGDRGGVYLHRAGAYSVEFGDPDGEVGASRFNPGEEDRREVVARTGKASLSSFVASIVTETAEQAPDFAGDGGDGDDGDGDDDDRPGGDDGGGDGADGGDPLQGLLRALEAVATAAEQAAERAEANDAAGADNALETVLSRLEAAREDLSGGDFDGDLVAVTERRLEQAERRAGQALESEKPS